MAKKQALGKGLSALLPRIPDPNSGSATDGSAAMRTGPNTPASRLYQFEDRVRLQGRVTELEVSVVRPNRFQPRAEFDEAALDELAASIAELGIIQPITVRALGDGRFELISGERRLRAAKRAGLRRIPAYVREADAEAMLEMAIVENIQREDLNPIEEALGYQRLIDECGLTQEDVATKVGKNRSTIANALRLLRLPDRVQACLKDRSITSGHARVLVSIKNPEQQNQVLDRVLNDGLTVREVEQIGRNLSARTETPKKETPAKPKAPQPVEPDVNVLQLDAFTDRLRSLYSTKVNIKHRSDETGKIELEYYTQTDLERLLDLLLRQKS